MSIRVERRQQVRTDPLARYERLLEIRELEDAAHRIFTEGRGHGITHTCHGQEAVAVGLASSVAPTDTVACTYRGHGMGLALGLTPAEVLGELLGKKIGCTHGLGGSMHLVGWDVGMAPTFAIVGAGIPVATGMGWAAHYLGADDIAVGVFGDGAANIGAFHEGLNLAAIWRLPVLFICENNLYGEYTRMDLTTPVDSVAERGPSYRMPSDVVDGQELDEVIEKISEGVELVRGGSGPRLLEVRTYRYSGHVHADPAPYRPEGELEHWKQRDPVVLYEQRLREDGLLDDEQIRDIRSRVTERVQRAEAAAFESDYPEPTEMFAHVYA